VTQRPTSFVDRRQPRPYQTSASQIQGEAAIQTAQPIDAYLRGRDLQAIIDAGQGDVPIKDLKFRCTECGSSRTDHVVTSRDALRVQPTYQRFVR
jgi:hypothetical protein